MKNKENRQSIDYRRFDYFRQINNKILKGKVVKIMCQAKCQDCLLSDSDKVCQYCQNYRYKDYNHICIKDSKKINLNGYCSSFKAL